MDQNEFEKLIKQMESELNNDPEHDADVMHEWAERYRGVPDAEPFFNEVSRRLISLIIEEEGDLPEEIFSDMVETADEDFEEACRLIKEKQYEDALHKLLVLTAVIRAYPLPEGTDWMDFNSYLDSLVYQDLYNDEIGEKEIGRHPMHPAKILYTCGSLLIEMDRAEEALEPLEMLVSFDPVCPKYLFELGEAYKRTGQLKDAFENALWGLTCAQNRADLARCYRDMAYCLAENSEYEDAVMFNLLSLHFQSTRQAEAEIAWIRKKAGVDPAGFSTEKIMQRCNELGIPVGISETVQQNIDFMNTVMKDLSGDSYGN